MKSILNIQFNIKCSKTETAVTTSTYTAVGVIFGISALSSVLSLGSFASLWSFVNQIQMIVLLIVSQIYLPNNVSNIILGNKIILNPLHYISLNFILFYRVLIGWFDSVQTNNGLSQIGLDSGSALVNNSTLIGMLMLCIPVHLFVRLVMIILIKWSNEEQQGWMIKLVKYLTSKTFSILTYGFYIRTIIESVIILALSTFSEIINFNVNDVNKASSFAVCTLIILVIIMFLALSVWLALRHIKDEDFKIDKYREFFSGLKKTKPWQLYITVWLCRRLLFVLLIISISPNSQLLALQILSVIQLLYFIYVVAQRPYIEAKDNLIEIINEFFFLNLLVMVLAFQHRKQMEFNIEQCLYVFNFG